MTWGNKIIYRAVYEYAGTNQHGDRYKTKGQKKISVARLESDCKNPPDIRTLILLSHELNVPVHYNYDDGVAYIEVIGVEAI